MLTRIAQLVADQVFNLSELERYHCLSSVLRYHVRVVAFGRHINQPIRRYTQQFRSFRDDDVFFQCSSLNCYKVTLFPERIRQAFSTIV